MSAKRNHRSANEYLQYLRGDLSRKERHSLERDLQKDPFYREAMEGLEQLAPGEVESDILSLHHRLTGRLRRKRRVAFYGIAATVASLLIIGTVFIKVYDFNPRERESSMGEETFPTAPAVKPSPDLEKAPARTGSPETEQAPLPSPEGGEGEPSENRVSRTSEQVSTGEQVNTGKGRTPSGEGGTVEKFAAPMKEEGETVPDDRKTAGAGRPENEADNLDMQQEITYLEADRAAGDEKKGQEAGNVTRAKKDLDLIETEEPVAEEPVVEESVPEESVPDNAALQAMEPAHEETKAAPAGRAQRLTRKEANLAMQPAVLKDQELMEIMGMVVSGSDREPVSGATVKLKGSDFSVETDQEGTFRLSAGKGEEPSLLAGFIGMENAEVPFSDQPVSVLVLVPDKNLSGERVLIERGGQPAGMRPGQLYLLGDDLRVESGVQPAVPNEGIDAYREYIERHLPNPDEVRSTGKAEVVLRMVVTSDGKIRNVTVLRSERDDYAKEAVRLVNEGPGWIPATDGQKSINEVVLIRMLF